MTFEFKFPDVGEGIQEGEIVKWRVKEGDIVTVDQVVAEVETDKAVVEIPSPQAGIVVKLHAKEGETIKVGSVLVTIGGENQKVSNTNESKHKDTPEAVSPSTTLSVTTTKTLNPSSTSKTKSSGSFAVGDLPEPDEENPVPTNQGKETSSSTKILATPKVKALAKKQDIDLSTITGSGKSGRILASDLESTTLHQNTIEQTATTQQVSLTSSGVKHTRKYDFFGFVEREPLHGMRKVIARRMVESLQNTAPVTHFDEADITLLHGLRERVKEDYQKKNIKLTLLPFIVKAVIEALKAHPRLNSSLENEEIILKKYYNIGIAVDTGDGLVVPVIKEAQDKTIVQIAKEITSYADKANNKKLDPMDMKGGSFTITNIGSIGGLFATPILNYPEAAILALGRGYEKPVSVNGNLKMKFHLPLSLTFDHRILDGAEAARFTNKVKEMLADPQLLLMESMLIDE